RLFTVQGSWSYERLQGIGVGVAEEPLLRDLQAAGNGAAYRAAVARGAHFFNAHPYLCGLAVGAAARAEHEGATPNQVERLRSALCGPLGSLGDRLRAPVVGARETHGTALRPGAARRRRTGGLGMAVIEREAKIVNPLGMHARPAAEFVKVANRFKSAVQVRKDDLAVNGKSIMG